MDRTTKILIIIMSIILIIFGVLIAVDNKVVADDSDSKQIADYEYQINELRKQKETCFNELSYEESKQAYEWFSKPCVQFDEQIMSLREKSNQLKAKSYDWLGLE